MNYKVTAITAFYNEENYIREAVDSLLMQSIGFRDNIQLVLINDGSTDSSREICEEYAREYPDNITLINKENSGVSDSRNLGMQYIRGKYTVFFDGDDIWEENAFQAIYDSFESFGDAVDTCTCRIKYIGDFRNRVYPLDYKYDKGRRISDLMAEPENIQITIGNVVFRSDVLKGRQFDSSMTYCEDSWFANEIIADKAAMGIIPDAVFYYRKNQGKGNQSVRIVETRPWYFDVIRNYYFKMFDFAEKKFGAIPEYFQRSIFYDIKWRKYNPAIETILTEDEKKEHLELLRQVLEKIGDEVILRDKDINQYQKLYLLDIKYGRSIINEAILKKGKYYLNDRQVLNLMSGSMLHIRTIMQRGDKVVIEGTTKINSIRRPFELYVAADNSKTKASLFRYSHADYIGLAGETVSEGMGFRSEISVRAGQRYGFYVDTDGQTIRLMPSKDSFMGLKRNSKHNYYICGDYLVRDEDGWLHFDNNSQLNRFADEMRFAAEAYAGRLFKNDRKMLKEFRSRNRVENSTLESRVAFISTRASDRLLRNMEMIWNAIDLPKVMYCRARLNKNPEYLREAIKIISTSKVVVLDDYVDLRGYNKKPGQKFVQLWHASGAGKKFGSDGSEKLPSEDAMFHREYDLVTVSSEAARKAFASAFSLPVEKVIATGVARTDDFFDEKHIASAIDRVYGTYPEFKDKKILMYAPTIRDVKGRARRRFIPELDFDALSEVLGKDRILVICPHPLMIDQILTKEYNNIKEVRDIATNDIMFVSDLLITDYSSVIFEYSLLRKPMAFYCYDYDIYDRDFYMDFDNELPGPLLRTQEELASFIGQEEYPLAENYDEFSHKYMGACDGHSTERIVKLIKDMYNK